MVLVQKVVVLYIIASDS